MSSQPPATHAALERDYQSCKQEPGHSDRVALADRLAKARNGGTDWLNAAFEWFSAFDFAAGHASLDAALAREPLLLPARWLRFQMPDHPAPESAAEAEAFRRSWSDGMAWFEALDLDAPNVAAELAVCLAAHTSFYRHYLGDPCLVEQRRYGRLCTEAMRRLVPPITLPPDRTARSGRRRLIVCSSFLHRHTVARLFVPLIEGLDPALFDVHWLHLGPTHDEMTEQVARTGTLHLGPRTLQQWVALARQLAADHVLHLDVGMDPSSQVLAACRLAPRQSMLWGHPVTTGLDTIDAFLSPEQGELPGADAHYTERLLRLPGLGHGLDLGASRPVAGREPRVDDAHPLKLFCGQSVYKYQPGFDALLARILGALPDAELHCIPHADAGVRTWLQRRIEGVCRDQGVAIEGRIHMHGQRPQQGYLDLAAGCDINLDTPLWSGGMSSADLLGLGLPTVTWESPLMRTRLTAALLRRCGRDDLIANSDDSYLARVIALAADRQALRAQRTTLANACARVDDRAKVVAALSAHIAAD